MAEMEKCKYPEKFGESIFGGFLNFSRKLQITRIVFSVYVRGNDKRLKAEFETLKKVKDNLLEGKHIRFLEWDEKETGYNQRCIYRVMISPIHGPGNLIPSYISSKGNGRSEQAFVLDCKTNDLFIEYGKEGLY